MLTFPESNSIRKRSQSRWLMIACLTTLSAFLCANQRPDALAQEDTHQAAQRPNVILIMTDDQGYGDIGFNGNSMVQTPNLDRLARESFRLTNFHVDPTCAETRAALMTGKYSMRVGVWHTIMGHSILRADESIMANVFRENGYRTGMFGKWHLGDNYPFFPENRGFDEVLRHGGGGVGQTPDHWSNDYFDDTYYLNGTPTKQRGYCTDIFSDAAIEFIKGSGKTPFFCYLATNAAHGPYLVGEEYSNPYKATGIPGPMDRFYGMITNIDDNVGKILNVIDELGIADNTIVIFMTDNGTAEGFGRKYPNSTWKGFNAGMRGKKGSQYEGGHRVPCFIRYPKAGVTSGESNQLVAHMDLFPTLIDLCHLDWPFAIDFDGQSLKPLFSDDENDFADRTLVVQSQRVDQPIRGKKHSVMSGNWRLVDGKELYDLSNDPGQTQDVSQQHPKVVESLQNAYDEWWNRAAKRNGEIVHIPIGAPEAEDLVLTSHDWHAPEGSVPWNQNQIKNDISSNGKWAVDIQRAGAYRVTLSSRPPGFEESINSAAGEVTLEIGEQKWTKELGAGDERVTFLVELSKGATTMKSTIRCPEDAERGAYFAKVEGPLDSATNDSATMQLFDDVKRIAFVGDFDFVNLSKHNSFETIVQSRLQESDLVFAYFEVEEEQLLGSKKKIPKHEQSKNSSNSSSDLILN